MLSSRAICQLRILSLLLIFGLATTDSWGQLSKPAHTRPAAEAAEQWDDIDPRMLFLSANLASTEASLEAIEKAIRRTGYKQAIRARSAHEAELRNEQMDRYGGGPVPWSRFYGTTAEKFFYHPVDRNTTYHTITILGQQPSREDTAPAKGIPSRQGLPVHQRPPQFDYVYRANDSARARAEREAAELGNQIDRLLERRRELEGEQAALWAKIALRAITYRDLSAKPLYRFELKADTHDEVMSDATAAINTCTTLLRTILSLVDSAQDPASDLTRIVKVINRDTRDARRQLTATVFRQASFTSTASDTNTSFGRFCALTKRLEDVATNLAESYELALDGDRAGDEQRKNTFRALFQDSVVTYAQIVLALDEMACAMAIEWQVIPIVEKPLQMPSPAAELAKPPSDLNPDRESSLRHGRAAPPPSISEHSQPTHEEQSETPESRLSRKVTLVAPYPEVYKGAPRDKLSLQYAVLLVAKQAGFEYDFATSLKNTDPVCRRWVRPHLKQVSLLKALEELLQPLGLQADIVNNQIVLKRR